MKPIDLTFLERKPDVTVKGEILDSKENPVVLSEDLLEVTLRGDKVIEVGWYPEHDPSGKYRVALYSGRAEHLLKRSSTDDPFEVVRIISRWIEEVHQEDVLLFSSTEETFRMCHA